MISVTALLLASTVLLVSDGRPRVRIETDDSARARMAADMLQREVVLRSAIALPGMGTAPFLRFERTIEPGYRIESIAGGTVIRGADLVRAVCDLFESWGNGRRTTLTLTPRQFVPKRMLWIEAESFDPGFPARGLAIRGLEIPDTAALGRAGYKLRVASTTFDDFLPPDHHAAHPEWFALRNGERVARGNFALTNPYARAAYLDALGAWLDTHPDVDVVGIWPEVTTVWCEESEARGHAESYALLWREAAARFPARRFEILATGLTLPPPSGGERVPSNVEVRFRPGKEASALQGIAGQEIEALVEAWEARGAQVLLEIDGSPESWVGMPWPCHDAVRANARRFRAAVLSHPRHDLARIWRDPDGAQVTDPAMRRLLARARGLGSWGHPRDAASLFLEEEFGVAHAIAQVESTFDRARAGAPATPGKARLLCQDLFFAYRRVLEELPAGRARIYRRYRGREIERFIRKQVPGGVETRVGPATVRDNFDRVELQTDRLRLGIDRETAAIDSLQLKRGNGWSENLVERFAAVVPLGARDKEASLGSVRLSSPERGVLQIDLKGREGTIAWESRLVLESASGKVVQTVEVESGGGVALATKVQKNAFDQWICPAYTAQGRLDSGRKPALGMPPRTLIYLRKGDHGPGLALRFPRGGTMRLTEDTLIATTFRKTLEVEWILFTHPGELGH